MFYELQELCRITGTRSGGKNENARLVAQRSSPWIEPERLREMSEMSGKSHVPFDQSEKCRPPTFLIRMRSIEYLTRIRPPHRGIEISICQRRSMRLLRNAYLGESRMSRQ